VDVGQVERSHSDLADGDDLSELRADAPGGSLGDGELRRRRDEVDTRRVGAVRRACVTPHLADVIALVGEVADWLHNGREGEIIVELVHLLNEG
jgi:hypothetical protein